MGGLGVDRESEVVDASWDSVHVIEVQSEGKSHALQQTSTILLAITGEFTGLSTFSLGGSMTRQQESTVTAATDADIVSAIGRMVEEMEGRMRSNLQEIYFGRTHEVVNELRPAVLPEGYLRNQDDFRADLRQRVHQ